MGGLGMRMRGPGAGIRIREGGQSWDLFTEGRGSEVRGGGGHANERARSWDSDPRGGSELGFVHREKGFGGESGGAGHANERAMSWDSDSRGGLEMGFVYRGKGFRGERGGLGMRMRGQGAGIWIRERDQSWGLFIEGRGSEVRVGGWACK